MPQFTILTMEAVCFSEKLVDFYRLYEDIRQEIVIHSKRFEDLKIVFLYFILKDEVTLFFAETALIATHSFSTSVI